MITRKKKECAKCGEQRFIFGKKLCQSCYRTIQKPIKKVSENYEKLLKQYRPLRKDFLEKNKNCQLRLGNCTGASTVVHHLAGKSTPELYLDVRLWMASCSNCNIEVERIGEKAYELGIKIRRSTLKDY